MEENQHHLYNVCKASKGNFVVHNFWFLCWSFLEKWIYLFSLERFHNFCGLNRRYFHNHDTLWESFLNSRVFLKFNSYVFCVKISVTISRDWPCFIWSISIERLWIFLWWTETDLCFSRSSTEDDSLSF